MPLESEKLSSDPHVTIRYVSCNATHGAAGEIEYSDRDTLVLPLNGSFIKHLGTRERVVATPASAVFFAKDRPYRVSHPCQLQDECVALEFDHELMHSVLTDITGADGFSSGRLRAQAILDLPFTVVRSLLVYRLRSGFADRLETAETSLALLAAAVRAARDDEWVERARYETEARRREQVDCVQVALVKADSKVPSLSELAAIARTTPFHLTRIFRQQTGLSISEYYARLRLARSIADLLNSNGNLTDIALAHGFSSHSHYTYAFRRRTGTTPGDLRRTSRLASHHLRNIMTALENIPR